MTNSVLAQYSKKIIIVMEQKDKQAIKTFFEMYF